MQCGNPPSFQCSRHAAIRSAIESFTRLLCPGAISFCKVAWWALHPRCWVSGRFQMLAAGSSPGQLFSYSSTRTLTRWTKTRLCSVQVHCLPVSRFRYVTLPALLLCVQFQRWWGAPMIQALELEIGRRRTLCGRQTRLRPLSCTRLAATFGLDCRSLGLSIFDHSPFPHPPCGWGTPPRRPNPTTFRYPLHAAVDF